MQRAFITLLPFAASGLLLAVASASPAIASNDPDFGCTVRQNITTHAVDMDPKYAGTLMEGGVGQRTTLAVRRYMTDKIRPLARFSAATAVGSQGGADAAAGAGAVTAGGAN